MKRLLLLLGTTPLMILVVVLAKPRDFRGNRYPGWGTVENIPGNHKKITKDPCLTAHGIHSAKSLGLAKQTWEVPKEYICDLSKVF